MGVHRKFLFGWRPSDSTWGNAAEKFDMQNKTTYNDLLAKDGAVSYYLHASMTVPASVPVLAAGGFSKLSRNLFGESPEVV